MNKATSKQEPVVGSPSVSTITADMSYWAMSKHFIATALNAGISGVSAIGNTAEALNKVALSANNYADVAVIFSEDEKVKAMGILNASREQLK